MQETKSVSKKFSLGYLDNLADLEQWVKEAKDLGAIQILVNRTGRYFKPYFLLPGEDLGIKISEIASNGDSFCGTVSVKEVSEELSRRQQPKT